MPTQEKIEKVAKVKDLLSRCESFFITDYKGLNVATVSALRTKLRAADARLLVEKNTLISVAARDLGLGDIDQYLTGSTAIAFSFSDPVPPAKVLNDSFKDKQLPVVKAFMLAGQMMPGSRIGDLADLPGRDDLLARVIGTIEGPIAEIIAVFDAVTQEFIGTVNALADSRA